MGMESSSITSSQLFGTGMIGGGSSGAPTPNSITGGRILGGLLGGSHQGWMSPQGKFWWGNPIPVSPFFVKQKATNSSLHTAYASLGDSFLKSIANTGIQAPAFHEASASEIFGHGLPRGFGGGGGTGIDI
jgi:hypothetical protein